MYLARLRRDSGAVVLAARIRPGELLVMDGVDGVTDDVVDTLEKLGVKRLAELVADLAARPGAEIIDEQDATFEVPVPNPSKIFGVALNYADHAAEGNQEAPEEPVIFFKPPSSLVAHGAVVRNPKRSTRLDYEVELAVVIGTRAANLAAADWRSVVCGYTVFNDVTARDLQFVAMEKNQPWDHSKAFDTFAPCGPYFVTPDEIPDPMDLGLRLMVDDEVRQDSRTKYMIFDIPTLIEVLSTNITLERGDIIATGTPSGIGPVPPGSVMTAEIENVGRLVNKVLYENESV